MTTSAPDTTAGMTAGMAPGMRAGEAQRTAAERAGATGA